MKLFGKELVFNGNKIYHAGDKPTASEIGAASSSHNHDTAYLRLNGSNSMTNAINNSMTTGTWLAGAQGKALLNSTGSAGTFTTLIKSNSTNGYFTLNNYQAGLNLSYTAKTTVDAGTNSTTKNAVLLNESGNTQFPGTVSASGGFSGNLTGNASTATKLSTARTISLNGDITGSVSFDGSANASISTTNRRCVVGQTASTATNPYYKFASITVPDVHSDREIVFKVSTGYSNNTASGILRAHVRTTSDKLLSNYEFYWEYVNGGIDPSKFILAYSTTAPVTVELWAKIDSSYLHYHFDVLQEHDRGNSRNRWTLYTTCSEGSQAAITTGYTQVASTRLDIANSITGNAKTATTLATARTINGTSFNGSANITTANWGTARTITIGKTSKSVNGSGNVSWTLAEIGVTDSNNALPLSGGTLTGDLTIKKSDGSASKLNVHRTLSSNDMQGSMDIYNGNGGSVALSTNNKTSNKQTSCYVFGGDAFWSPRDADGNIPDIGSSSYRFKKAWLTDIDVTGTSNFRGAIYGINNIALHRGDLYLGYYPGTKTCDYLRFNKHILASDDSKLAHLIDTAGARADLTLGTVYVTDSLVSRSTGDTYWRAKRTDTGTEVMFGVGAGGINHGVYSKTLGRWLIYGDAQDTRIDNVHIDGYKLSIASSTPSSPATGDIWIQI